MTSSQPNQTLHTNATNPNRHAPLKVLMILETAFPSDARVEREASALIQAGYEVSLFCSKAYDTEATYETVRNIPVIRWQPESHPLEVGILGWTLTLQPSHLLAKWCNKFHRLQLGAEQVWAQQLKHQISRLQPDVVHVHDLKLLPTVITVLKAFPHIRCVSDLHENYPALLAFLTRQRKSDEEAAQKQRYWQAHERYYLPQVDQIIVVAPEAKDRLLKTYPNLKPERIHVVDNVVDLSRSYDELSSHLVQTKVSQLQTQLKGRFVVAYVGYINNRHRGLHTVIEAIGQLKETYPDIALLVVGGQRPNYVNETLKPLIERYKLEDSVFWTDFVEESAFGSFIQLADVCVCPHMKTELTDTTFPNKVYLYGLYQKPMLVSDCLPLKRYVEDTGSGLVFKSENPQDCAQQLQTLINEPEKRQTLGKAGKEAVVSQYNWAQEKQTLLAVYQTLTPQKTSSSVKPASPDLTPLTASVNLD